MLPSKTIDKNNSLWFDATKKLAEAKQLIVEARFADALNLLEILEPALLAAQDEQNYIVCLIYKSDALCRKGEITRALQLITYTVKLALKKLGRMHLTTADAFNMWGICCYFNGNITQTGVWYMVALNIRLAVVGVNHMKTADSYANVGAYYYMIKNYPKSIELYKKAIHIYESLPDKILANLVKALNNLAICYRMMTNRSLAYIYYHKSLNYKLSLFGENHPDVAESYISLGMCKQEEGEILLALDYFTRALSISKQFYPEQSRVMVDTYKLIGICHKYLSDYDQALIYLLHALSIHNLLPNADTHATLFNLQYNIGLCYYYKRFYKKALSIFNSNIRFWQQNPQKASIDIRNLVLMVGNIYYRQQKYGLALRYYRKSGVAVLKSTVVDMAELGIRYLNTGNCFVKMGKPKTAIKATNNALNLFNKATIVSKIQIADTYNNLATAYTQLGKFKKALHYCKLALGIILQHQAAQNALVLPHNVEENLQNAGAILMLFNKAKVLFKIYLKYPTKTVCLCASVAHLQLCDALIEKTRSSFLTEGSRLELAKEAKSVYAFTLKTLHTAQQNGVNLSAFNHRFGYNLPNAVLPLAHYYMERSKNALLLAHVTQAEAKLKAQLPAAVLEKERELNAQLLFLSRLLEEEHNKTTPDENKLNRWQQQYFAHKMAYDELLAQIDQENPHYSQLKQQYHIPTINHIQQAMPTNMAIISYVTGKRLAFIFVITHHNCTFTTTPLEQITKDVIKNFDFLIQNDFDTEAYTQAALHLYQCLLEPALANAQTSKNITSLLFLPDEKIAAIPFEALLTHAPAKGSTFAKMPYLINHYDIGYHLSAALWYKSANAQTTGKSVLPANQLEFAGFAPVYQNTQQSKPMPLPTNAVRSVKVGNTEFDELVYSEQEVAGVEHLFKQKQEPTKAYLHLEANLSNFIQYAHRAKHLLISAHAHYNKKSPKLSAIIFSPDKPTDEQGSLLYMPDIYTLQFQNTDLLTLSCCDTGIGKQVAGEGVLGLNRAFLYAGVKNIIFTLFKVYDYSSSQLSLKLYALMLQDENAGKTYLEILSQAKRQLIQEGKIAAPKHWSGFVLVGAGRVNL